MDGSANAKPGQNTPIRPPFIGCLQDWPQHGKALPEDEQTLFEIRDHPDFPGERLVACRNPRLAGHRARVRQELLEATEKALAKIAARVEGGTLRGEVINTKKMKKHFRLDIAATGFGFSRDRDSIDAEAALDGIYIIRTSLGDDDMDAEECVRGCKALTRADQLIEGLPPWI